jgi:hypothetical protein
MIGNALEASISAIQTSGSSGRLERNLTYHAVHTLFQVSLNTQLSIQEDGPLWVRLPPAVVSDKEMACTLLKSVSFLHHSNALTALEHMTFCILKFESFADFYLADLSWIDVLSRLFLGYANSQPDAAPGFQATANKISDAVEQSADEKARAASTRLSMAFTVTVIAKSFETAKQSELFDTRSILFRILDCLADYAGWNYTTIGLVRVLLSSSVLKASQLARRIKGKYSNSIWKQIWGLLDVCVFFIAHTPACSLYKSVDRFKEIGFHFSPTDGDPEDISLIDKLIAMLEVFMPDTTDELQANLSLQTKRTHIIQRIREYQGIFKQSRSLMTAISDPAGLSSAQQHAEIKKLHPFLIRFIVTQEQLLLLL